MIGTVEPECVDVDSFMLSCRVLGRRVEHAMLEHLAGVAARHNRHTVRMHYRETAKNAPARAFLSRLGADYRADVAGGFDVEFPHETLRRVVEEDRRRPKPPAQETPPEAPVPPLAATPRLSGARSRQITP